MKKFLLGAIAALCIELVVPGSIQANCCGFGGQGPSGFGHSGFGSSGFGHSGFGSSGLGEAANTTCEFQSGPCVCECPYTYYKPCYYYTTRCVQEPYPVCRTCCRYVPKQYQVTKCRYVPQYYNETFCKMEPEYYGVQETCYRPRQVCDLQCRYVPITYTKKTCHYPNQCQPCCPTPSPSCSSCSFNPCCDQSPGRAIGWNGFAAPMSNSFASPMSNSFAAPMSNSFAAPTSNSFAAPTSNSFGMATWSQGAPMWQGR